MDARGQVPLLAREASVLAAVDALFGGAPADGETLRAVSLLLPAVRRQSVGEKLLHCIAQSSFEHDQKSAGRATT